MNLSMNEVEATARKAARGAGYAWGNAEEAGRAIRWLCTRGLNGCGALARLLPHMDGMEPGRRAPRPDSDPWSATDGALCPLLAGVALADFAFTLDRRDIHLAACLEPLLLLPFAAQAAREIRASIELRWQAADNAATIEIATDGDRTDIASLLETAPPERAARVAIRRCDRQLDPADTRARARATPDPDAWRVLNRFAGRTYAPASEESRRRGAGTGLSDND